MKHGIKGLALACGVFAASSASAITLDISPLGGPAGDNLFTADIAAFFGGAANVGFGVLESAEIDAGGETLEFNEAAGESANDSTLTISGATAGGGTVTETSNVFNNFGALGAPEITADFLAGLLSGSEFEFASTNGVLAGFGATEMGVFYDKSKTSDSFILAFDDNNKNIGAFDDDNHDDYLWVVSTSAGGGGVNIVPLPASIFLLGGALAGLGLTRRRKTS